MNHPNSSVVSRPIRALVYVPCVALSIGLGTGCQSPETHQLGLTTAPQNLEQSTEPYFVPVTPFGGRWVGQAESPLAPEGTNATYRFPSGSSQILLDLTDPSVYYGKLIFGSGEPPPPPTDPDVGYPVGVSYADLLSYSASALPVPSSTNPLPPFEGFEYAATRRIIADEIQLGEDGEHFDAADGVIVLEYNAAELLQPWCALQTPLPGSNGHFDCAPEFAQNNPQSEDGLTCNFFGPPDRSQCPPGIDDLPLDESWSILSECEGPEPLLGTLDCNKAFLCDPHDALFPAFSFGVCDCDETSCQVDLGRRPALLLLRVDGDGLTGVFGGEAAFVNERGASVRLGSVHFRRAE